MQNTDGSLPQAVVDSCSFDIGDNARLEDIREKLYRIFVRPAASGGKAADAGDLKYRYGLLIRDETYLTVKAGAESHLKLLRLLLPLLAAGMGLTGFLATLLWARRRRQEFAVMRCLGLGRKAVFELMLQDLLFCAAPGAAVLLTAGALARLPAAAAGSAGVLLAFLAGGCAAAWRAASVGEMELMKTEE